MQGTATLLHLSHRSPSRLAKFLLSPVVRHPPIPMGNNMKH